VYFTDWRSHSRLQRGGEILFAISRLNQDVLPN